MEESKSTRHGGMHPQAADAFSWLIHDPRGSAGAKNMDELLTGLKAAAESTRLRLLLLCSQGELTVSELTTILRQSQPRVSRHLKLLCDAGLLDRFQEGTWVFYRTSRDSGMAPLVAYLLALIPENDATARADLERLAAVRRERFEKAAAYFRENAAEWDKIRSLHAPEAKVEQAMLDLIGPAEPEELLDIGTGTGRVLEIFSPRIGRGLGIDISRGMLSVARAQLSRRAVANCEVRLGNMYDLPVESNSVDAVTIHQVLHFADDPAATIEEAARTLRKGGQLVVVDFARHDREDLRELYAHRRLGFRDSEIDGWFRRAGLVPEETIRLDDGELTVVLWPAVRATGGAGVASTASAYSGVAI
jgi:ubiquinone/menaquinone biosynthesis C-methylase UbiE